MEEEDSKDVGIPSTADQQVVVDLLGQLIWDLSVIPFQERAKVLKNWLTKVCYLTSELYD